MVCRSHGIPNTFGKSAWCSARRTPQYYPDAVTLRPGILPLPREENGRLLCEVLWADRFGNLQLNVSADEIEQFGDHVTVRFGDQVRTARRRRAYGDIKAGEVGLVVDSYGLLSLAFDRLPATSELGLHPGDGLSLSEPE